MSKSLAPISGRIDFVRRRLMIVVLDVRKKNGLSDSPPTHIIVYLFRTPAPLYKEKSFYPRTQYIKYLLNQAGMFLLADGKEVWHQLYLMRI